MIRSYSRQLLCGISIATAVVAAPPLGEAQVVRDGTIGAPAAGPVGPGIDDLGVPADYLIDETLGGRAGGNLFHSFSQFDLGPGTTATFTAAQPTDRILSRVTGGAASALHGRLRSTVLGADLFFMNPAGVLFGEGSSIDVSGSLHVTTAASLRLGDAAGTRFPATATPPVLVSAPVAAFGFLDAPGPISVENSSGPMWAELERHQTLSLFGGPIQILGNASLEARDFPTIAALGGPYSTAPTIRVPEGRVELVSVTSVGDLEFTPDLDTSDFPSLGDIDLQTVGIDTRGSPEVFFDQPGGSVVTVRSNDLSLRANSLFAAESRAGDPGVDVVLRGDLLLDHSEFWASARVAARHIRVLSTGGFEPHPLGPFANSGITTLSFSNDRGGDIDIDADSLTLNVEGPLAAWTSWIMAGSSGFYVGSGGEGGNLRFNVGDLRLDGGWIAADSTAPTILISGFRDIGGGGFLSIDAETIALVNSGFIGTVSNGRQTSGDITIRTGSLLVQGAGPTLQGIISSSITSNALGGEAGNIDIEAKLVEVLDGGAIASTSGFDQNPIFEGGGGGNVRIRSDRIVVAGAEPRLRFVGGADGQSAIAAGTSGPGRGGEVELSGRELLVDGATITSTTTSIGEGGGVSLDFDQIDLMNGARVEAASIGFQQRFFASPPGTAGDVSIRTETLRASSGSTISVESVESDAGDLSIHATDSVELFGSALTATADGAGGNIDVAEPVWIILENGGQVIADATEGQGGNISLGTQALLVSQDSTISASSDFGVQGEIEVSSPFTDVAQNLTTLPTAYVEAPEEMGNRCEAGGADSVGRFVVAGNRGIPESPDAPLWADAY